MLGVIGEVMIELRPAQDGLLAVGVAGDTFNTSVMMAHLGRSEFLRDGEVSYFTALGTDSYSSRIRQAVYGHGINSQHVLSVEGATPGLYVISNDEKGQREFTYWRDTSAAKQLFSSEVQFRSILPSIGKCSAIYWSGITLALQSEPVREIWFEFLKQYRDGGGQVFFDSNFRPALWSDTTAIKKAYEQAVLLSDYYLPSLEDEMDIHSLEKKHDVIEYLAKVNCKNIILTADDSVVVFEQQSYQTIPLEFSDSIVDATGAGDAFSGAFASAILGEKDIQTAIQFAHIAASHVVQCRGAILDENGWESLFNTLKEYQL